MKWFLVFVVAFILGFMLIPLSFIYALVTVLFKNIYLNVKTNHLRNSIIFAMCMAYADFSLFFKNCAISIDQLGNTVGYKLFNDILIKKNGYKFGNPDETISSVLGKNLLIGKLSLTGKILNGFLNWLDPEHSTKSIEK